MSVLDGVDLMCFIVFEDHLGFLLRQHLYVPILAHLLEFFKIIIWVSFFLLGNATADITAVFEGLSDEGFNNDWNFSVLEHSPACFKSPDLW